MPSLTEPTVLLPSDLIDYMDTGRAMELLTDDIEGVEPDAVADIDSNTRALKLARAAWAAMVMACRRGDIYDGRELVDLANDEVRGQSLVELVADLFWCRLQKRRRYVEGEPQAADPTCEQAEKQLELLQTGHRIFVLDGVTRTDSDGNALGVYTNVKGPLTAMSVGQLGSDDTYSDPLDRYFGCTDWPRVSGSGGCGC